MGRVLNTRYCGVLIELSIQFCEGKVCFPATVSGDGVVHFHSDVFGMIMSRDPIELEIFKNIYHSIAEEMGAALRRTAFSPNIKERRDYSCAVFDGDGEVISMGDHMPVHLGSMPMSVRAAIDHFKNDDSRKDHSYLGPGDVVMLNDPFRGGTHLPDITLVAPVYVWRGRPR